MGSGLTREEGASPRCDNDKPHESYQMSQEEKITKEAFFERIKDGVHEKKGRELLQFLTDSIETTEAKLWVDREELLYIFGKGINVENATFSKFFRILDYKNGGFVELITLTTCLSILLDDTKSPAEFVFAIFDTNRDGFVIPAEMNNGLARFMTSLSALENLYQGKEAFREFIREQHCAELYTFLETMKELNPDEATKEECQALYNRFLQVGTDEQVNVSDECREKCLQDIDNGNLQSCFLKSIKETERMLEQGVLCRLREGLDKGTVARFSELIWKGLEVPIAVGLQMEQFQKFVELSPNITTFVANLKTAISE